MVYTGSQLELASSSLRVERVSLFKAGVCFYYFINSLGEYRVTVIRECVVHIEM